MKVDEKQIDHIAALGRLKFTDQQKKIFIGQFSKILEYVEKVKSVDINKIEPLVHTFDQHNVFRPDENKPSLTREQALSNAPEQTKGFFKVPRVIE
ncbi:MAG: Asp-tRNA(Asn)/Glu-tRNA(Gln) amidotransferase subunit GatC [Planctomycetes bacterium]|nr:Asp-tRNA(Asn)/Glu-tRNA(Gln) amidotransferase subunit GatC [Planctomycetota bacterium]